MSREVFLVIHPRHGEAPEEQKIAELSSLIPEIRRHCNIAKGQVVRVVKGELPRRDAPGLPTEREVEILACIQAYIDRNGYPPSLADISRDAGVACVNLAYIARLCARLVGLGLLERSVLPSGRFAARSLRLADAGRAFLAERVGRESAW